MNEAATIEDVQTRKAAAVAKQERLNAAAIMRGVESLRQTYGNDLQLLSSQDIANQLAKFITNENNLRGR